MVDQKLRSTYHLHTDRWSVVSCYCKNTEGWAQVIIYTYTLVGDQRFPSSTYTLIGDKQQSKNKCKISIKIDDRVVFKLSRYIWFYWTLAFSVVRIISLFWVFFKWKLNFWTSPIKEF